VNGDAVIAATKDLGVRFRFVSLLPVTVLALYVLALVWSGAPGKSPDLQQVLARAKHVEGWTAVLLALTVVIVALIAEPLQVTLVRLLEGYWGESRAGRLLAAPGKAFHRARRNRLDRIQRQPGGARPASVAAREEAARKLRSYPPTGAMLPTKLGNLLRAAENRAGSRYGLDAITVWPRLYPLLADKVTAVLDDLRDQLDIAARFCVVFLLATVFSVACLAGHGWWLIVAAGTLAGAALSYRAALGAGVAYGQAMEAAFDLHRFDLLTALHLPLPADLTSEVKANQQLSRFLRQPYEYMYALTHADHGLNFTFDHRTATTNEPGNLGIPTQLSRPTPPQSLSVDPRPKPGRVRRSALSPAVTAHIRPRRPRSLAD
jgi:hypothetical protein